ncbi:MAG: site-specific DNA-methyltransferase [Spirochaetia bacterium]|jgi:site-specific DNA-methyltransferase (adenine-specific)|nr:site-specific DNA-methyltransferase [Spirochaetia bacterium]
MREPLPRLDSNNDLKEKLIGYCRLKKGEVWTDPVKGHRVGVLDATSADDVERIMGGKRANLVVNDPPYNIKLENKSTGNLFKREIAKYIDFSKLWIKNADIYSADDSWFYLWLGADQKNNFSPLPEIMMLMRDFSKYRSRSYITLRNQRGYGTQKNWMCIRQELLCYQKGEPSFKVIYTDIPKVLKGYYKTINGNVTENIERSRSQNIRPGNVWIDIQQVFYLMEENVPGAYAQKSLKSIERIILTSSRENDIVADYFAHSGTTLIAAEKTGRICRTFDLDPVFAELTIRRLERYRDTGKTGWQCSNPFPEIGEKYQGDLFN